MRFLQFLAITYMDIGVRIETLCPLPFNIRVIQQEAKEKRYEKDFS